MIKKYGVLFLFSLSLRAHSCDVVIAGALDFCDGLGKISYGLIDHIGDTLKIGYSTTGICTLFDDPYEIEKKIIKVDDFDAPIFLCTNSLVMLLRDESYTDVPETTLRIAYSMFETDTIPSQCIERLNTYFDAVLVPDEFLCSVYKKSGLTIPVYCIPTGLYLEKLLDLEPKQEQEKPFTFGCISTDIFRKNLKKLVSAFAKRYGNDPEYQLKLHTKYSFSLHEDTLEEHIEKLGVSNIELTFDAFDEDEYTDFVRSLDCYILLSTGEGFSNTPREALAAGVPCILSNNTGHTTICNSGTVLAVDCPVKIDAWHESLGSNIGKQFDCHEDDVIAAMETMVLNYKEYYQKAQEGRRWVKQYLWPELKDTFLAFFSPQKVLLGSENKIEKETKTVYTDNRNFYNKMNGVVKKKVH